MAVQRYRFLKSYRSGAGAWDPGQTIEIEPERAEWFNRDVPGCLEPVEDEKPKKVKESESEERAADAPPHDRMVKGATKRGNDPISRAEFKATETG
jgi:hypothetical protein